MTMKSLYEHLDAVPDRTDNAALSEAFLVWLGLRLQQRDVTDTTGVPRDVLFDVFEAVCQP